MIRMTASVVVNLKTQTNIEQLLTVLHCQNDSSPKVLRRLQEHYWQQRNGDNNDHVTVREVFVEECFNKISDILCRKQQVNDSYAKLCNVNADWNNEAQSWSNRTVSNFRIWLSSNVSNNKVLSFRHLPSVWPVFRPTSQEHHPTLTKSIWGVAGDKSHNQNSNHPKPKT